MLIRFSKAALKSEFVMITVAAALLAGTAIASAQGMRDDPPGSRFQTEQENIEEGELPQGEVNTPAHGAYADAHKGQCWNASAQGGPSQGYWSSCSTHGADR